MPLLRDLAALTIALLAAMFAGVLLLALAVAEEHDAKIREPPTAFGESLT